MSDCDAILAPNVETIQDDYTSRLSYVYSNAEKDWELLRRGDQKSADLGVIYGGFMGDFSGTTSASEFQQKVRAHLANLGFATDERSSRAHQRSWISDKQADDFVACKNGGLILQIKQINNERAVIRASYRSAPSGEHHDLELQIARASGREIIKQKLSASDNRAFIIERLNNEKRVSVVANIPGYTDDVDLNFGEQDRDGGLLGSILIIGRRVGTRLDPYDEWQPHTIRVYPETTATRWKAAHIEYMTVTATKYTIAFEVTNDSTFRKVDDPSFDGFVISGFSRDIRSMHLTNTTSAAVSATIYSAREVDINIRNTAEAGHAFVLAFEF